MHPHFTTVTLPLLLCVLACGQKTSEEDKKRAELSNQIYAYLPILENFDRNYPSSDTALPTQCEAEAPTTGQERHVVPFFAWHHLQQLLDKESTEVEPGSGMRLDSDSGLRGFGAHLVSDLQGTANWLAESEYIGVMRITEQEFATDVDKDHFQSGGLSGTAVIFRKSDQKPICRINAVASNSATVGYQEDVYDPNTSEFNRSQALSGDLERQLSDALSEALYENSKYLVRP